MSSHLLHMCIKPHEILSEISMLRYWIYG